MIWVLQWGHDFVVVETMYPKRDSLSPHHYGASMGPRLCSRGNRIRNKVLIFNYLQTPFREVRSFYTKLTFLPRFCQVKNLQTTRLYSD
jgi:hypothetical protein